MKDHHTYQEQDQSAMKNLYDPEKQDNTSNHKLIKEVYQYTLNFVKKNNSINLELDQIADFLQAPQATRQIILALKQNLILILPTHELVNANFSKQIKNSAEDSHQFTLQNQIKERDIIINDLEDLIQSNKKDFKNLQLKLLNNIKKLNQIIQEKDQQLQQKELQLYQVREIMEYKYEQMESMTKTNDKKYKKIRELEEDVYDLQQQLKNKRQELLNQKNCSFAMEKRLSKVIEESMLSSQLEKQNQSSSFSIEFNLASELAKNSCEVMIPDIPLLKFHDKNSEVGIQTEETQQKQNSGSGLAQSRESQYIESIQRLTCELSEAYQRINVLANSQRSSVETKALITKAKTSSTYFGKKK